MLFHIYGCFTNVPTRIWVINLSCPWSFYGSSKHICPPGLVSKHKSSGILFSSISIVAPRMCLPRYISASISSTSLFRSTQKAPHQSKTSHYLPVWHNLSYNHFIQQCFQAFFHSIHSHCFIRLLKADIINHSPLFTFRNRPHYDRQEASAIGPFLKCNKLGHFQTPPICPHFFSNSLPFQDRRCFC